LEYFYMNATSKSVEIAGKELRFETGKIAKLCNASVVVSYGETMVLVAVTRDNPRPGIDFFPLTVDYRERMSAAGRFPGGFFKREGRPTEKEILTCRLIDRPVRPLFPDGYNDEVQIMANVLSADVDNDPDVLAMNGAFAALAISDIPFNGPLALVRVGCVDGEYVLNPTYEQRGSSTLDLLVAGKPDGSISLFEVTAKEAGEEDIIAALKVGQDAIAKILEAQLELVAEAGKEKIEHVEPVVDAAVASGIEADHMEAIRASMKNGDKGDRMGAMAAIKETAKEKYNPDPENDNKSWDVNETMYRLEAQAMRECIMNEGIRCDGRDLNTVRPLEMEVGLVPRSHGSALFSRGQTQALVTITLGTVSDEQVMDALIEETRKRFMLHYNFPPYCVGECRAIRGPGRREIGHGALAERALVPVLPEYEDFPYTIKVTSDITESNGSSSMASTCGGSLAMMDAGVPITGTVAGVSVGLVKENGDYRLLTDILGVEDHLGDMDFKVTGTRKGVTAIQLDIKIQGLSTDIVSAALKQARDAHTHILDQMDALMSGPREEIKEHAPRITIIQLPTDKIRDVIGPGGKMIRQIVEDTGAKIDIEDDGRCVISSANLESGQQARDIIESIIEEVEVGKIYKGKVVRLMNFGAFVQILPGTDGMVHISQLHEDRVNNVEDVVKEGDVIHVKVVEIDNMGRINLSKVDADREMGVKAPPLPPSSGSHDRDGGGRGGDRGGRGGGGGGRGGDRGGRGGGGGGGGGRR
jgi:polyribonucleotide nucleotidyltransferase